jgi:hypothetical protein
LKNEKKKLHMLQEEENEQEGMVRLEDKNGASDKLSVKEASDLARKRMFDKQEELCKISQALALLSSASVKFQ